MQRGYYTITRITDYGPYVTKIILPVPVEITEDTKDLQKAFSVYVERLDENGNILEMSKSWMSCNDTEPYKGYVPVLNAFPSTRTGEKLSKGTYITLEMKYGPTMPLSSTISAPHGKNIYVGMRYFISQIHTITVETGNLNGLIFDFCLGNESPDTRGFLNSTSCFEKEPLNYGYFVPQKAGGKKPLIIWLHGAGEGGEDATIAYTANKVVNLASEKIQNLFGGAYILVPQAKTFWMNDGSGEYGRTGKSIYVEALKATIDEFIENNSGIDCNRIYIGGDSNGGFMTMRMIIDYPGFFAAAFPVCEALYDETISNADIENMAKLPIWFTHAKNDPVVNPKETAVTTYKRLRTAGAQNLHFTYWDNIKDLHGEFLKDDGKPYEYMGHFAWIPMLNDDCKLDFDKNPVVIDGKEVTLLQWLAMQSK